MFFLNPLFYSPPPPPNLIFYFFLGGRASFHFTQLRRADVGADGTRRRAQRAADEAA